MVVTYDVQNNVVFDGTSLKSVATINDDGLINYCIEDALICFFHEYDYGVLTCQVQSIAIFKTGGMYYIVDSHKRGKNGLTDTLHGTAVLITFANISEVAIHVKRLFSCVRCQVHAVVTCNNCQFSITPIIITSLTNVCSNSSATPPTTSETSSNSILSDTTKKLSSLQLARNAKKLKGEKKAEKQANKVSNFATKKEHTTKSTSISPVKTETDINVKAKQSEEIDKKYKRTDEMKQQNLKKMREKYQTNSEIREKKIQNQNTKYTTNETYREKHSSEMKEKYQNDEAYHNATLNKAKNRPITAEGTKRKLTYQKEYTANKRNYYKSKTGLHLKFNDQKREMPTIICICCAQLFFKKSTISECKLKVPSNLDITEICTYRCHLTENEKGDICTTCANNIKKDELKGLSNLEERLVSARIPFMQIRELGYQKQLGLRGNCVNVPIDINKTVTCLPRMDSEDDTLLVQLMRRMSDKNPYAYEHVRPERVFNAAKLLVNTELYKKHNITLNENWLQQFQTQSEIDNTNSSSCTDSNLNEVSEIDDLMDHQETLLTGGFIADSGIRMAPGEGQIPLSLTLDKDNDVLAFPTIYGGKPRTFKVQYSPVDIAKAEARHHDRRVATNIPKLMMNFCKARVHKLKSRISINLRKKVKTDAVTVSQILKIENLESIIEHNDGFKIVSSDRSSPAFWQAKQKKVMAMLRQFGSPAIFMTFSAAETRWNPLLVCLYQTLNNITITEEEAQNLPSAEKMNLIRKDPVTVARYIVNRFDAFRSLYREKNGPFYPYEIDNDFFRIELQFRDLKKNKH
ncbi:hypothetical protein FOCC_FOCC006195 [Frankliniella occidentalis]|nr:hypothetical protein FOCC_FOCC006195 [Frankliniella occidentalis]